MLMLEAARQHGLVEGGPPVKVERCEEILQRAYEEHGIEITSDEAIEEMFGEGISPEHWHAMRQMRQDQIGRRRLRL
jgi:hypothetical protein